jgi:hypothetical protein
MASSGVASQFGGKKETTWGTAVTVDKFWEVRVGEPQPRPELLRRQRPASREDVRPDVADEDHHAHRRRGYDGGLPEEARRVLPGPDGRADDHPGRRDGLAYNSTFLIGSSVPTKSATLQVNKPTTAGVDTAFTYPGSVLVGAQFSMAVGGVLTDSSPGRDLKDETTPATTPAGAALATATTSPATTSGRIRRWRSPTRAGRSR